MARSANRHISFPPSFRHARCYCRPMTVYKIDTPATEAAVTPRGHLAAELVETLRLGHPIAAQPPGPIARMTPDLAFIGRLGGEALGAAALAGTVYFMAFTVGMGLMSAVAPLAA